MKHKKGDRVRHPERPEWGIGEVTKVELLTRDGKPDRRVWIRFPSVGSKTVLASVAGLETLEPEALVTGEGQETLVDREDSHELGWLGEIAKRQPEEAMIALPSKVSDPFVSIRDRLQYVLKLYRFEPTGGKLVDWAVAQTGLDDPLSRFNRHELEQFYERWMWERDRMLVRLMEEARKAGESVEDLISAAPNCVRRAIKRVSPAR
ncbi:MAG: DUF3553 domain-containing protein [Phycisphaerales bacterium]|nr:DUF3553 domain-containing protein [Phycisphaerales bacterium]